MNCPKCSANFEITDDDRVFYKKFDVPEPTICFDCRLQRKLVHSNQLHLYKRKCDLTGQSIISNYHADHKFPVYEQKEWFTDKWDACDYAKDYDFNRPFFEQYNELLQVVPRSSLLTGFKYDENCEYTHQAGKNKNCYLIFDSDENRDTLYSYSANQDESCMDVYRTRKSELCYECIDCFDCYNLVWSQDSVNCSNSAFLKNCIGCKSCIMCSNLKNKEYHIDNKPVTKEQFEQVIKSLSSYTSLQGATKHFDEFKSTLPQKYMHGVQNENVIGDYLTNCKNAINCFDSSDLWDCRNCVQGFMPIKDSMDSFECGEGERFYESLCCGYASMNLYFTMHSLDSSNNLYYCNYCPHASYCFGCVGCVRKKYCILNKQYTEEQYKELLPKIIEHMKSTKEFGEFIPMELSPFGYNETVAQEYYPKTKEEVLKMGLKWRDKDQTEYVAATSEIPDNIKDVDESICNEILACETCGKNYKIVKQELAMLKQWNMPLQKSCFHCRHARRKNQRNKKVMYDRNCDKCNIDIQTTYPPERPEKIYCEKCYQESLL